MSSRPGFRTSLSDMYSAKRSPSHRQSLRKRPRLIPSWRPKSGINVLITQATSRARRYCCLYQHKAAERGLHVSHTYRPEELETTGLKTSVQVFTELGMTGLKITGLEWNSISQDESRSEPMRFQFHKLQSHCFGFEEISVI